MKIKRLAHTAKLPTKAHDGDLGYDLYASRPLTLYPGETGLVETDIAIEFPYMLGGIIKDRSSVATKRHLFTVSGVIDSGYTGAIKIAMHNASEHIQAIAIGDKIAQMILTLVITLPVQEVDEIHSSDGRSHNGFGSSGEI
jgi:dUTP pyrophosphatase